MNLIIYVNQHYEEEEALYDLENKKIILKGDYYHDKIFPKIEGYLLALKDHGIYSSSVKHDYIDSNHELYGALGFYFE